MNTFLPYPPVIDKNLVYSFANSAKVLDDRRLGKQRVEGHQILQLLCGREMRWKNHPAVLMWKNHEFALRQYTFDICNEWTRRGFNDTILEKLKELTLPNDNNTSLPFWMSDDRFHASHRSRLLFKGEVDCLIKTVQLDLGIKKPHEWIQENGFPKANQFKLEHIPKLEKLIRDIKKVNISRFNFYRAFGWNENYDMPYIWPVTIKEIRRKDEILRGLDL